MRICPQKRYHAFVFIKKGFDGQDDRLPIACFDPDQSIR